MSASHSPNGTTPSPGIQNGERRSSFGFLRKKSSASIDHANQGRKVSKSKQARQTSNPQMPQLPTQNLPPQLPTHQTLPNIGQSFAGENGRQQSPQANLPIYQDNNKYQDQFGQHTMPQQSQYYPMSSQSNVSSPIAPSSLGSRNGDYADPFARTESMTHRGRYSYASSAISAPGTIGINSPRRVRRRKDPTPFK